MITLFDLLVVAAILGCAYWGWLVGLEAASIAALELLACLSVAVMLHEPLAGCLHWVFTLVVGDWIGGGWSILLAFALLAWGLFALVRMQLHRRADAGEDVVAEIDPLTDRLSGAVAGGLGGAVLAGGALVTLSMIPFLAGFKPSGDRMLLDVGKLVLRAAGQFAGDTHEGRALPLWGEPPSRISVPTAGLTSEPWFDADEDGAFSDADRFRDVDGNGTFTKDLYFTDVDADGMRRVGLIDKYVVGRWDGSLRSDDRPRPAPAKPAPAPAKPAPAPAKPAPALAKPAPAPAKPTPPPQPAASAPEKPPADKAAPPPAPPAKPMDKKATAPGEETPQPPSDQQPTDDF